MLLSFASLLFPFCSFKGNDEESDLERLLFEFYQANPLDIRMTSSRNSIKLPFEFTVNNFVELAEIAHRFPLKEAIDSLFELTREFIKILKPFPRTISIPTILACKLFTWNSHFEYCLQSWNCIEIQSVEQLFFLSLAREPLGIEEFTLSKQLIQDQITLFLLERIVERNQTTLKREKLDSFNFSSLKGTESILSKFNCASTKTSQSHFYPKSPLHQISHLNLQLNNFLHYRMLESWESLEHLHLSISSVPMPKLKLPNLKSFSLQSSDSHVKLEIPASSSSLNSLSIDIANYSITPRQTEKILQRHCRN